MAGLKAKLLVCDQIILLTLKQNNKPKLKWGWKNRWVFMHSSRKKDILLFDSDMLNFYLGNISKNVVIKSKLLT